MDIQEILSAFERYDGTYQREAVDAAIAQREAIIPHLIAILESVAADPPKFIDDDEDKPYYAHVYAAMLLGHFQAAEAHSAILNVFGLPEPYPEDLFGDLVTEQLPILLTRTCNGSLESIKALAVNPEAYVFSRTSTLQAIAYGVLEGWISREDALSWFESLLKGADPKSVTNDDQDFYNNVGFVMCDLCPTEVMETVRWAFEHEVMLLDFMLAYEDFEDAIASGPEKCLEDLRHKYERNSLDDIHGAMEWWACFQPDTFLPPPEIRPSEPSFTNSDFNMSAIPKKKKKKKFWDL